MGARVAKRRRKVQAVRRVQAIDTEALARSLVARGLASPRILDDTRAWASWRPATERRRRRAVR